MWPVFDIYQSAQKSSIIINLMKFLGLVCIKHFHYSNFNFAQNINHLSTLCYKGYSSVYIFNAIHFKFQILDFFIILVAIKKTNL